MSGVQTLRAFVNQRLTAAAEEIFGLFERTVAEYEEELCRQRKLLDAVFKPEVRLHRADVQQLLGSREEAPPEQQDWSPSLDQEDPPELPHIKEEQEELWTSQEGEQLQGLEEADITEFTFPPVPVKGEDDEEEEHQPSRLHEIQTEENRDAEHLKTEADGEDCGGPESARNFNPESHLQPATHETMSHSIEPETDGRWYYEETRELPSGLNRLQNSEAPESYEERNTGKTSVSSPKRAASFSNEGHMQNHNVNQSGVNPFSCPIYGKRCNVQEHLKRLHSEEKSFSCSVCKKVFFWKTSLCRHMRVHTGEKPHSCSVCGKRFTQSSHLTAHFRIHTGEKPFTCSVCDASFSLRNNLSRHMRTHTREKPHSCSVCGKGFTQKSMLLSHFGTHTGEKPFSCSVCGKTFGDLAHLRRHLHCHTGKLCCCVCGEQFTRFGNLKKHKCVSESSRGEGSCKDTC